MTSKKDEDATVKETETIATSLETSTATNTGTSASSESPNYDDFIIIIILLGLALTLLYIFILYLLKRGREKDEKDDSGPQDKNNRRYRFGRMRKNSNNKAWLDPLDYLDSSLSESSPATAQSPADLDDADQLIKSNISREFLQEQFDPFDLKPKKSTTRRILRNWDTGDFIGIGLAAGCAILFIFILSNLEE